MVCKILIPFDGELSLQMGCYAAAPTQHLHLAWPAEVQDDQEDTCICAVLNMAMITMIKMELVILMVTVVIV